MRSIVPAHPRAAHPQYPYKVHRVEFVTLFPEMVMATLGHSILGRASEAGVVEFRTANPRDFCHDRHAKVDERPFGGEPGMLIRAEPVARAVEWLDRDSNHVKKAVVLTAPTGRTFDQNAARELAAFDRVTFLCGHYEGIDHRVEEAICTHVFSIGDYVLTNGELPALIMADAMVRLLPGVLGSAESLDADSFSDGLLSAPNYTRPAVWRGREVPAELTRGDHKAIARWRRKRSLQLTRDLRPDLLAKAKLTKEDLKLLEG